MLIFIVSLVGDISWKIHRNDPAKQDLTSLPGCFFINPLLYPKLELPPPGLQVRPVGISGDVVLVRTGGIVLGTLQTQIDIASVPFKFDAVRIIDLSNSPDPALAIIPAFVERLAASLR